MSTALKSPAFLCGAILFPVGLTFLIVGVSIWVEQAQDEEALRTRGLAAEATVLARSLDHRQNPASYLIEIRFSTLEGVEVVGRARLQKDAWDTLSEGAKIPVSYLPDEPGTFSVTGQYSSQLLPLIFCILGTSLTLVGGIFLLISGRSIRLFRRLTREGMRAQARVIEVAPTSVRVNHVRKWRIRYRYNDSVGGEHEGKSPYLSPEAAQQWRVGDIAEVRFDPRQTSTSVWVGTPEQETGA